MPAPLKIVVLEDNDALRYLTVAALKKQQHNVVGVYDAEGLNEILAKESIDLLILDLNLPGEDGISVASRLKEVLPNLHIIMTTARGSISDRVIGYDHDADMYLSKPISERELVAAVESHARRLARSNARFSGLTIDLANRRLIGAISVSLSETELTLLRALAQAPEQRAQSWWLLETTGRELNEKSKASLEVQMVGLRKKLALAGYSAPSIRSIRGEGYQLLCRIQII